MMRRWQYQLVAAALFAAFTIIALSSALYAYPVGDEFQVNNNVDDPDTPFDNDQVRPDVAMDANGNFVVVFQNDDPNLIATVVARLYDMTGEALGDQFQVNTTGINDNTFPKVSMDADGDFVVVWQDNAADGSSDGIMMQRYDAAGIEQGMNVTVNATTQDQQHRPDVAMAANGDFVVVWEDSPFGAVKRRIRGQLFSSDGDPQGGELEISIDPAIDHAWPRVAMDADGGFVVCWESGNVGANTDLAVRRFDAMGNALGDPFLINNATKVSHASGVHSQSSVAIDADGNFVVAWRADSPGGASIGIVGQRFDATGMTVGDAFEVDTRRAALMDKPEVAMNAGGDFVIAYEGADGSLVGTWAQRYYADGLPKGAPFLANSFTSFSQRHPAIGIDSAANAAVVWESSGNAAQDGAGSGIFGQRLSGLAIQAAMDFNNDFRADIPWRHHGNGENAIWEMNGFSLLEGKLINQVSGLSWEIAGVGDFNRDGAADLLWRHGQTGKNVIWLMVDSALESAGEITPVADLNWRVAGVGDVNKDGKADIVWQHALSGNVGIWLMDGLTVVDFDSAGSPGADWRVVGVDDFNADGKSDIVLRHTDGQNAIWLMNGVAISEGQLITPVSDPAWRIVGTGDFDGDGKADLLWRHALNGSNAIWLMDGFTVANTRLIQAVTNTNWKVAGVRDFNRDVKADILWRNAANGQNAIWLMDRFTLTSGQPIAAVNDNQWTVLP